jgi:hypothetical protein
VSRFAVIPTIWVRHQELTPTDKAVLLALATYADTDRYAYPSLSRLADDLALSVRTVRYSLRQLEEVGALRVERRTADNGDQLSNGYWVTGYDMMGEGRQWVAGGAAMDCRGPGTGLPPNSTNQQDQLTDTTTTTTRATLVFEHESHQLAYEQLRRASRNPAAVDASLRAEIDGMTTGKPVPIAVIGQMLLDLAANGEPFNVARLRGYLRKQQSVSVRAEEAAMPHAYGKRLAPTDAEIEEWDRRYRAEQEAKAAAQAVSHA